MGRSVVKPGVFGGGDARWVAPWLGLDSGLTTVSTAAAVGPLDGFPQVYALGLPVDGDEALVVTPAPGPVTVLLGIAGRPGLLLTVREEALPIVAYPPAIVGTGAFLVSELVVTRSLVSELTLFVRRSA